MITKATQTPAYDLIGDIHGHADPLRTLLEKLEYKEANGHYSHPSRQVIFVGDFIDRGPAVRETLEIVKAMTDAGSALAVMGNHEYNAICYSTKGADGNWLRDHSDKNKGQQKNTEDAFADDPEPWQEYLAWFRELPLYLELPGLRVIHACWDQEQLDYLNGEDKLTEQLLHQSARKGTREHQCIEILLKGKELERPEGYIHTDKDGNARPEFRINWWVDARGKTYRELSFPKTNELPDTPIPAEQLEGLKPYPADAPPVFFGHYWLQPLSAPAPTAPNVACIDYSIAKKGILAAYQWDGESTLHANKFVVSS